MDLTMSNVNEHRINPRTMLVGLAMVLMAMFATTVLAGSGGDAFQGVFDDLIGMAEGVPGQIIAFLSFSGTIVFSMVRPNLVGLGISVLIMVVLAQLQTIITSMLTAALPF